MDRGLQYKMKTNLSNTNNKWRKWNYDIVPSWLTFASFGCFQGMLFGFFSFNFPIHDFKHYLVKSISHITNYNKNNIILMNPKTKEKNDKIKSMEEILCVGRSTLTSNIFDVCIC
jgi:hypothetical protein